METVTRAQGGPPPHRQGREESFYVLEGDYVFEVDGWEIVAGAGCSIFAPRGTAHTSRQPSGAYACNRATRWSRSSPLNWTARPAVCANRTCR
jgi:mannose-6-phosphate isomerase-like protein (cupin superfamily)